jgi:type I restriction enzyme S subunit
MSSLVVTPLLAEKIEVLSGFAFPSSGFDQLDGLPLIRIRDLANSITEVRFQGRFDEVYRIHKGDLLIGMDGDFEVHRWRGEEALLNQRVCKITSASAEIDQRFLYWYLKPKIAEIHRKTPQTTVRHLSTKDIHSIAEPAISVAEQQLVAQILDALDAAICDTEQIIAKLKAIKLGLLHDLLTRGIGANGELRPLQAEVPHLYKPSPLGWIPKEWNARLLLDVSKRLTDGTHQAVTTVANEVGDVPFLFVSCVRDGEVAWDKAAFITIRDYQRISRGREPAAGMVLYTAVGSYGHAAEIGETREFAFQRHIACIYPDRALVASGFMPLVLNWEPMRRYADRVALGNAQKTVTLGALSQYPFVCPERAEQEEIVRRMRALQEKLTGELDALKKLQLQKSGLMDDLLTDRVRVTPLLEHAEE